MAASEYFIIPLYIIFFYFRVRNHTATTWCIIVNDDLQVQVSHSTHIPKRILYFLKWLYEVAARLEWKRLSYHQEQFILLYVVIYINCSVALQMTAIHASTFLYHCYILQSFILVVLKKSRIVWLWKLSSLLFFSKHIAATDLNSKLTIQSYSW